MRSEKLKTTLSNLHSLSKANAISHLVNSPSFNPPRIWLGDMEWLARSSGKVGASRLSPCYRDTSLDKKGKAGSYTLSCFMLQKRGSAPAV